MSKAKTYSLYELNEHQIDTLAVLLDIGGWATSGQMQYHGVNHASAEALCTRGFAESRVIKDSPFGTREWCIKLDRLGDLVDLIEEGSVYQKLISSYHREVILKNQVHSMSANAILGNMSSATAH